MTPLEWSLLLALAILWGGSYFFISVALRQLPPLTLVALRVSLAAALLNAIVFALGLRLPRDGKTWMAFGGVALLNNVLPFCLIAWGQKQIASGLAAILVATTPVLVVIAAHFLTADEKMTRTRLSGVLVGLAGVAVLVGPAILTGLGAEALAELAVLAASLCYALAGVFGKRFHAMGVAPLVTATGQLTASAVMLTPVALAAERPWTLAAPGASTWAAVLGIATLSTALAFIIYFRILATAGATNLSLVSFLIPVTAVALGSLVLGEALETHHVLGMALIAGSLAVVDGRAPRLIMARRIR